VNRTRLRPVLGALRTLGYAAGLPALALLAWVLATDRSASIYFPPPATIASAFVDTWFGPAFTADVLPSLGRFAAGVLLSIVIGIVAGTAIGTTRWLRDLLEPMLEFFRAIPPVVLVPVLMLMLGVGDTMRIAVIVSGCVWPVLLNTVEGVRGVDTVLTDTSRSYRVRGPLSLRYVVLPAASPQIMAGIRLSLSIGLILMVISEMFAASSGLGYRIVYFQRSFMIAQMWSGIVLLGLVGVAVAALYGLAERRVLHWYHGMREVARG
jgi:ABC-type nitrate/sulfonate/bicarbonate transport system permease component